jgi:hypothetical protein
MSWSGVAVERTADFVALVMDPPMGHPNRCKRPVILAFGGEPARVPEQIRQSVNPRGRRSRVAGKSYLDLRLRKQRRFVGVFCRIYPLVAFAIDPRLCRRSSDCTPMRITGTRAGWIGSTTNPARRISYDSATYPGRLIRHNK